MESMIRAETMLLPFLDHTSCHCQAPQGLHAGLRALQRGANQPSCFLMPPPHRSGNLLASSDSPARNWAEAKTQRRLESHATDPEGATGNPQAAQTKKHLIPLIRLCPEVFSHPEQEQPLLVGQWVKWPSGQGTDL